MTSASRRGANEHVALAAGSEEEVVVVDRGRDTFSPTDWRSLYWNHAIVSMGARRRGFCGLTCSWRGVSGSL